MFDDQRGPHLCESLGHLVIGIRDPGRVACDPACRASGAGGTRAPARQSTQTTAAPGGCVIKGNRNRRGEWICHMPGMPYCEQT